MGVRRDGQIVPRGESRWQLRWFDGRDASGKRHYRAKTLKGTRRAAQVELRRILRSRDTGEYIQPSKETLDAYLDRWLEGAGSSLEPRTLADYRRLLRLYVRPHLGSWRLERIKPVDVQALIGALEKQPVSTARGRRRKTKQSSGPSAPVATLSPRTIRLAVAVLGAALKQGVRWGVLYRNPVSYVQLPKQERREMLALSAAQVATLRAELVGNRHAALFDFLLGSGTRPGEALALRWADLDLDTGNATIRRSLTTVDGKPAYKDPKTAGSRRAIPLPPALMATLRRHKAVQAEHALELGAAYDRDGDLVFGNEAGGPLDLRNVVARHFKGGLLRAKLPKSVRLYDLRHSHATALLAAGVHPKVAAERLGHSTTRQTLDTYSHVLPGMQAEATRRIEELFFGG